MTVGKKIREIQYHGIGNDIRKSKPENLFGLFNNFLITELLSLPKTSKDVFETSQLKFNLAIFGLAKGRQKQ